jgi:AcrR family transcriptional regulator
MIEETKGLTFRFLIFYGKQRRVFVMKERILEGGMAVYRKKGPKFTMDDLANELGMSKKTIYTVFRDKKSLLYDMVDYTFDAIKQSEAEVLADTNKSTIEKLRGILGVMPERFRDFDFTQVYEMKDKYPECYDRIQQRLESGWETTLGLLRQGVEEGSLRPVDETVFQVMYEAAIERFIHGSEIKKKKMPYMDALNALVDIMMDGAVVRK